VAAGYNRRLAPLADSHGVSTPYASPKVTMSWFVYVVRLAEGTSPDRRDAVLARLRERGVGCGNYFPPIHLQPFCRELLGTTEGDFPVTEALSARTIALPFFNKLTESQIDRVAEALAEAIDGPA
jgi:perosamine synthetase